MSLPEDAASVLEQFIHDVANIPAEITHLLEEIQAKDNQIQTYQKEIARRDLQLQKWVYTNGGHVRNPKEESFSKVINDCYDKCEILQAEKCGLSEKAMIVLDRQVKRLDVGLRGLAQTEQFPADWTGPSLLNSNATGPSLASLESTLTQASSGPLQVISGNIASTPGGAPNFAHQAAQMRLAQSATHSGHRSNSISGASSAAQPPTNLPRSQREGSSEASNKRRRTALNQSLNIPASASNLRQSSLGPGTPKAGTPGPGTNPNAGINTSRAGSAQPSRPGNTTGNSKKSSSSASLSNSTANPSNPSTNPSGTNSQPSRKIAPPPPSSKKTSGRARPSAGATKKSDRRRQLARDRATPSTNASNSGSDDDNGSSASPTPSSLPRSQIDGSGDAKNLPATTAVADDEDGDDDQLYCLCQKVSFGDMVGCDNDNCRYQWFHYKCVNVTEEPVGEWLCPDCRTLPRSKLRISKD